jgi:rhodanese-related sulfurtransferase
MTELISARQAKERIHGDRICALLDVREEGQFGEAHPFLAVNCPYSHFEERVARLVPSTHAPTILIDDGDGVAHKAALVMAAMGYENVCCVEGGIPAWRAAGFNLFKGVYVPSKTLGELVEHLYPLDRLSAVQLADWQAQQVPFKLFDCRPPNEFSKMTLPGAQCVPNGELAHRFSAVVKDEHTPIVLTCAGRTRGLIGVAGLSLLGVPNPLYALENGTQGWTLAELPLLRGQAPQPQPAMGEADLLISRSKADALIEAHQLACIGVEAFEALAKDASKLVYLVDVRSDAEFAAGHLPGATHAWGGQMVQALDLTVGARRATVVLTDDTGMRAAVAAFWLRCLGYETFILRDTPALSLSADWRINVPKKPSTAARAILDVADAVEWCKRGDVVLVDLRPSQVYRKCHISQAVWANRSRLDSLSTDVPLVLCADNIEAAQHVAQELANMGRDVRGLVTAGVDQWREAGVSLVTTPDVPADAQCVDFLFFVHDRHDGNLESAKRYLAWEQGLIEQLDHDERAVFELPLASGGPQHSVSQ